jgi:DNA-binding transcriptional regulator LsrR (DeoR family)
MTQIYDRKMLYKVLRMYYLEHLTQNEVAKRLEITRVKVARYLGIARELNLVETKLTFNFNEYEELEAAIEDTFGIRECRVVRTFADKNATLKSMAVELGKILERVLRDGDHLGVSWGTTLKAMGQYLVMNKKFDVKVIPIAGGTGIQDLSTHINFICRDIAEKIGGMNYTTTIPSVLDSKATREILEKDSNSQEILRIAKKVVTTLVSIGDMDPAATLFNKCNLDGKLVEDLKKLGVEGYMNFKFFNRMGKYVPNKLEERIIQILTIEDMKKVENIIAVAFGEKKVGAIRATMKGKLIHRLITDRDTAKKLLKKER